jgi:hypothetical protein
MTSHGVSFPLLPDLFQGTIGAEIERIFQSARFCPRGSTAHEVRRYLPVDIFGRRIAHVFEDAAIRKLRTGRRHRKIRRHADEPHTETYQAACGRTMEQSGIADIAGAFDGDKEVVGDVPGPCALIRRSDALIGSGEGDASCPPPCGAPEASRTFHAASRALGGDRGLRGT